MAEVIEGKEPKIIAFYLPQFHEIPENNEWWGEGFTEWTNVKKAVPQFEGHLQPNVPLDANYYDLTDDRVKIWQANLAKQYGVFGFCYYHYWFKDGRMLLEKPAEQMLANKAIDLPFCFSWANENWSKNWDGGNREVIMKQDYGDKKDWEKHFQYLLPFFKDPRYITVDGKPLFIVYKPDEIIDIYQMLKYFRKRIRQEGFSGICLAFQFPTYYSDMFYRSDIFDYRIGFEPVYARNLDRMKRPGESRKVKLVRRLLGENVVSAYRKRHTKTASGPQKTQKLSVMSFDEAWNNILTADWTEEFLPGAFAGWDNTPRNKTGVVYQGFSVVKFADYMQRLMKRAKDYKKPLVFINAWNEWGEGAYLEPDEYNGYRKLEGIRDSIDGCINNYR